MTEHVKSFNGKSIEECTREELLSLVDHQAKKLIKFLAEIGEKDALLMEIRNKIEDR